MFDVISVGDCVIDTFVPLLDACVEEKGEERKLILRYGDKIPVGPSISLVAGNAANNAVGSARLGLKTAIYTNVGEDEDGVKIVKKYKEEGIDIRYVQVAKGMVSNHHVVLDYKAERTILIYHQPWKFHLPELERTRWVYFTSLSPSFVESNLIKQLIDYLERTGVKMLYNPGTFQIKHGVKKDPRLLCLASLFIVNVEEAKLVLGYREKVDIEVDKLLTSLADLGPKMVVVTDGGEGSYGFDGERMYKLGVFPAKLLEMTGSGDAYATGVLAGLAYGENLGEAMRWGAANGASVVEQIGPQAGLLTLDGMKKRLKEGKKIVVKDLE